VTTFAWTPGGPLAQRIGPSTRYLVKELHEDIDALADPATGSLAGSRAFGPWGAVRRTTGEASRLGYQSDLTDPDTGLVDMMTRLYDPAIGRFQTRDTLFGVSTRPQRLNQAAYGEGNPTTNTDPMGMAVCAGCPPISMQVGGERRHRRWDQPRHCGNR